jgi:hypothetical protein
MPFVGLLATDAADESTTHLLTFTDYLYVMFLICIASSHIIDQFNMHNIYTHICRVCLHVCVCNFLYSLCIVHVQRKLVKHTL